MLESYATLTITHTMESWADLRLIRILGGMLSKEISILSENSDRDHQYGVQENRCFIL
jgi:hypothetical protein